MITDRTLDDVLQASQIRDAKVKTFQSLTEDEQAILERGFLTKNTINRIETTSEDVGIRLRLAGYYNNLITTKFWADGNIFKHEDFERVVDNVNRLVNSFFVRNRETAEAVYDYESLNTIERLLVGLDEEINSITYRECGTFECGEVA